MRMLRVIGDCMMCELHVEDGRVEARIQEGHHPCGAALDQVVRTIKIMALQEAMSKPRIFVPAPSGFPLHALGKVGHVAEYNHPPIRQQEVEAEFDQALADAFRVASELRVKVRELEGEILALRGTVPREAGAARFRRREPSDWDLSIASWERTMSSDQIALTWTMAARRSGLGGAVGAQAIVKGISFQALPRLVKAESWWHLCSIVGLTEAMARFFYHHPEAGQVSSVEGASRALPRGPQIYCQTEDDW